MNELTRRQQEILDWIVAYIAANGESPTLRELADGFDFPAPSYVREHLNALERKGWISRRKQKKRSIRVLKGPDDT